MKHFSIGTSVTSPRIASAFILAMLTSLPAAASSEPATRAAAPACGIERADPAASTPGGVVKALYAIVSGPPLVAKDWARLKSLHAPGALITPTQHTARNAFAAAPQTLPKFIELNERLFAHRGFFERETFQRIQTFGHIAHVWSGYETREQADGPVQQRGINSFQLLHDGSRWCVLSATWDTDTPAHPMATNANAVEGLN